MMRKRPTMMKQQPGDDGQRGDGWCGASGADGAIGGVWPSRLRVPRSGGRRTDSRRRPRGGRRASTRGHRPGRPVSMWPPAELELRPLGSARLARRQGHAALSVHGLGIPPPRASRKEAFERFDSAPLRGEFLRWVPDRLPLRFAPLQASGKALLRERAPIPSTAFPGACSESGMRPGTQRREPPRSGAELFSPRSPQGRR